MFENNGQQPVNMRPSGKKWGRTVALIVLGVIVLLGVFSSLCTVSEGYVGVKYRFGKIVDDRMAPGLNFKIPIVETVTRVDVREQIYETSTNAYTKDTQTVENLRIKLNYCYDQSALSNLIRNIGINNVESKLIVPQVQSIVKNEIGQFRAEELIQNRSVVQNNIQQKLAESLSPNGIVVTAFAIEDIDFENGFEEAVRAKVVAEQEALKMQNKTKETEELARQAVIEAQAKADSEKIQAEAEAYSIRLVQEELTNSPQYIEFEKIKRWNGQLPQAIGETVNPFVMLNDSGALSSSGGNSYSSSSSVSPEGE